MPLNFTIGKRAAFTTLAHPRKPGLHNIASLSKPWIPISGIGGDAAPLPWLADGVVYPLPQSWILGFTTLNSATQFLIYKYGYAYWSQLWKGYFELETREFTVNDVITVLTVYNNTITLFVWVSRYALPYASYIMQTNYGLKPTSQWGPIVPGFELAPFAVDSSAGPTSITLQYVAYVPDVTMKSGNTGWS